MNLAQAWEEGFGTAIYHFHGMDIIVKYVDERHVAFKFGTEQAGYTHIPLSPIWAFGEWLTDLGILAQEGWEPGKEQDGKSTKSIATRHKNRNYRRRSHR
jgi:hypothetical protein